MKKALAAAVSALLLTACAGNTADSGQSTAPSAPAVTEDLFTADAGTQTAEQTDAYDPFAADNTDRETQPVRSYGFRVDWEEGKENVLDYAPTVSFRLHAELEGTVHDMGLLIFVNGFSQPFRTDETPSDRTMHISEIPDCGEKALTVEFEPVTGELGDTLSVQIVPMLHPRFVPSGPLTGWDRMVSHSLHPIFPSDLTVTQKTGLKPPAVCTNYQTEPVTDALRQKYDRMNSTGGYSGDNDLDNRVFLDTLKNGVLITPKDRLEQDIVQTPFTKDDTVTLCMYGGAAPCTYRVSAYLDHELIKGAFDGLDYIDMTPSRDRICKKKIAPEKVQFSPGEYHHLYFIAVPVSAGKNNREQEVLKSESAPLYQELPGGGA
ncbi:MAG: hypothetical protein IK107_02285 [Oscillospiraceae bacterium]|nr:hypothetical protein [Oscillospiraceae bacterium]